MSENNKTGKEKMSLNQLREDILNGKLDIDSLDISVLSRLMSREINLLCQNNGDEDFVTLCSAAIDRKKQALFTHEEYTKLIDNAIEKATAEKEDVATQIRKKCCSKRLFVWAAAIAVISAVFCITATSETWLKTLNSLPPGSIIHVGDKDAMTPCWTRGYSSVEEAIEKEKLSIMYPTDVPGDLPCLPVTYDKLPDGKYTLSVRYGGVFEDPCIGFSCVFSDTKIADKWREEGELYTNRGITYKLIENKEGLKCSAYTVYNGVQYDICANTYEEVFYIIENLKLLEDKN